MGQHERSKRRRRRHLRANEIAIGVAVMIANNQRGITSAQDQPVIPRCLSLKSAVYQRKSRGPVDRVHRFGGVRVAQNPVRKREAGGSANGGSVTVLMMVYPSSTFPR